jgi:hypothetical protein
MRENKWNVKIQDRLRKMRGQFYIIPLLLKHRTFFFGQIALMRPKCPTTPLVLSSPSNLLPDRLFLVIISFIKLILLKIRVETIKF